jgi:hypothetical protein
MLVLLIVVFVAALLLAFDFAALHWGYDSRDGFRYLNREDVRLSHR